MAKVKNVIKGCNTEYGKIEDLMIQDQTGKIIFWGPSESFYKPGCMEEYRAKVENSEVSEKQVVSSKRLYMIIEFE